MQQLKKILGIILLFLVVLYAYGCTAPYKALDIVPSNLQETSAYEYPVDEVPTTASPIGIYLTEIDKGFYVLDPAGKVIAYTTPEFKKIVIMVSNYKANREIVANLTTLLQSKNKEYNAAVIIVNMREKQLALYLDMLKKEYENTQKTRYWLYGTNIGWVLLLSLLL